MGTEGRLGLQHTRSRRLSLGATSSRRAYWRRGRNSSVRISPQRAPSHGQLSSMRRARSPGEPSASPTLSGQPSTQSAPRAFAPSGRLLSHSDEMDWTPPGDAVPSVPPRGGPRTRGRPRGRPGRPVYRRFNTLEGGSIAAILVPCDWHSRGGTGLDVRVALPSASDSDARTCHARRESMATHGLRIAGTWEVSTKLLLMLRTRPS
jgi:hypothetical protein